MTFDKQISLKRESYISESYPMSIGEIINLYKDKEIDINPDYQRFFRWSIEQKSRFMESVILGIPTPSIFVFQRTDGVWELVDGLQRVSTILSFIGELKNEKGKKQKGFELSNLKILSELNGKKWGKGNKSISSTLMREIKREKIPIQILSNKSVKDSKFEVFMRLNTGGSFLSNQEVRNCLMLMTDKKLFSWIEKLSNNEDYLSCLALSDRSLQERYNMELVIRYLAINNFPYKQNDISEYFDDFVKEITLNHILDFKEERDIFISVFKKLNAALGDSCFKKYDNKSFKGKFLESAFEAISVGIRKNHGSFTQLRTNEIKKKIKEIWKQASFLDHIGSGSNAKTRLPKMISFGKKLFK